MIKYILILSLLASCNNGDKGIEDKNKKEIIFDGQIYTLEEAFSNREDLDQTTIKITGFLYSDEIYTLWLVASPLDIGKKEKSLRIPDWPFQLKKDSWSRALVLKGVYQVAGDERDQVILSPINSLEVVEK